MYTRITLPRTVKLNLYTYNLRWTFCILTNFSSLSICSNNLKSAFRRRTVKCRTLKYANDNVLKTVNEIYIKRSRTTSYRSGDKITNWALISSRDANCGVVGQCERYKWKGFYLLLNTSRSRLNLFCIEFSNGINYTSEKVWFHCTEKHARVEKMILHNLDHRQAALYIKVIK